MSDRADDVLSSSAADLYAADRLLTVAECARRLGCSQQFVRDEIKAGALKARERKRQSGRTLIRIPSQWFAEYQQESWTQR